jgi:tRNA A37 threonylcarbamoyladenosine modification protein TsaB
MYTSTFRRDGSVGGPPVAMTPAIAVAIHDFVAPALPAGTMLSGDAAAAVQHRLPALALAGWEHPHAEDLLAIARATLATDGAQDVASALPVYLEGSSAWRKSGAR